MDNCSSSDFKRNLYLTSGLMGTLLIAMHTGCGTAQNGRDDTFTSESSKLAMESADLRVENKVLEQELRLARQEGAALTGSKDNRQIRRGNNTNLTRLRDEVEHLRRAHDALAQQVLSLSRQNEEATATLSQLNGELLAQIDGRRQAEAKATSYQTQLRLVLARKNSGEASQPLASKSDDLDASSSLAQSDPEQSPPVVSDINPDDSPQVATHPSEVRFYLVVEGDTLESISKKCYGIEAGWRKIFAANNDQLRDDRRLKVGMRLVIPE